MSIKLICAKNRIDFYIEFAGVIIATLCVHAMQNLLILLCIDNDYVYRWNTFNINKKINTDFYS